MARLTFDQLGSDKKVVMFDTFAGMTEPGEKNQKIQVNLQPEAKWRDLQREDINLWSYASISQVRQNFLDAKADFSLVNMIAGDVRSTLRQSTELPQKISILRLDTDFYDSTLAGLEILYPRLVSGGIILIDDYGSRDGSRRAVEEFFADGPRRPALFLDSYSGRVGVKP